MISLALVGKNISHSRSCEVYERLLGEKINYDLIDCQSESDLPSISFLEKYDGVSITSPYKKHYVGKVTLCGDGLRLQSINCLAFHAGNVMGLNTDYLALKNMIPEVIKPYLQVAVLGDGVMASIVTDLLKTMGVEYSIYSRRTQGDISRLSFMSCEAPLVINCCSREYTFEGALPKGGLFWDMNYSSDYQRKTIEQKNGLYMDGYNLLKLQARFALNFWQILD